MNINLIAILAAFCLCCSDCLSQTAPEGCEGNLKNSKRYEVEQGRLKYFIYSTNGKGKKKHRLFTVDITFEGYGSLQKIKTTRHDLSQNEQLATDSSFLSEDGHRFLLSYFVLDSCSVFYKGIYVIKPVEEKYKGAQCIRFIQYRFYDYAGKENRGTVRYCQGIPVYIRGGDTNRAFIWELQSPIDRKP